MVILLEGSSDLGRMAIAEKTVEKHPTWKHLALGVIEEMQPPEGEEDDERPFHLQVVKRCVDELAKSGLHLVLSLPEAHEHLALLKKGLQPDCVVIHLGTTEDDVYDYVIDTKKKSMNDILKFLDELIVDFMEHAE
jgi:hypothetical protein